MASSDTQDDVHGTNSTLGPVSGPNRAKRGLWIRRSAIVLMVLVQLVAVSGWLGVHSQATSAVGDGYRVEVTYPRVARPGLDVAFTVRVEAPTELTEQFVLGITADYFRMFEKQGFYPEPSDMSSDGDLIYLTFAPPPSGRVTAVDFDAYIQPAAQLGKSAQIVLFTDGTRRATAAIHTSLVP